MAGEQTKKRGSTAQGDSEDAGGVEVEVSTRLPRRIRAGVTVRREPRKVTVTQDQLAALDADPRITVKRL